MQPDLNTMITWQNDYLNAPRAQIDENIKTMLELFKDRTSMDLLHHIFYDPHQRDQGSCNNCWVWAGTGIMEIALDVEKEVLDRLSIQYFNSCYTSSYACCPGNLDDFAAWYGIQGLAIPWSNPNASFVDVGRGCADGSSLVSCGSIPDTPSYAIRSIAAEPIIEASTSQTEAIIRLKTVLQENKGIFFGISFPNATAVSSFFDFWGCASGETEETLWPDTSTYCGQEWEESGGAGGHAVLLVGYNDDDPDPANHYWIALNSWGDPLGRPNGLFRIPIQMDYECEYPDTESGTSFSAYHFFTLKIDFAEKIIGAEYFIDNDPGEGYGMPISSPIDGAFDEHEEEVELSDIDTSGLTIGLHEISVRFIDEEDRWSLARGTTFRVSGDHYIAAAEYFFDNDPGEGHGFPIYAEDHVFNEPEEDLLLSDIDTSSLPLGIHTLFLRVLDSDGFWSAPRQFSFEVSASTSVTNAEYYIDTDPGPGNGFALLPLDGDWGDQEEDVWKNVDTSSLSCESHQICVRTQDNYGRWGPVACENFFITSTDPDDFDSDGIPNGEDNCPETPNPDQFDEDEDGWGTACDCIDINPWVHPEAEEICGNGIDDDCDDKADYDDPDCLCEYSLELNASYEGSMFGLNFSLGTAGPANWANYLILTYPSVQVIPLWTSSLPAICIPVDIPTISFTLPSMGWVCAYTYLFSEGIEAYDLACVDTGI